MELQRWSSKQRELPCSVAYLLPSLSSQGVTNFNFLLTISIHSKEKRLEELIKWSPKGKIFSSSIEFSQLILYRKVWRSVWRICMFLKEKKIMTRTHQFCSLLLAFHSFSFLKFFFQFFHFSFSLKITNHVNVVYLGWQIRLTIVRFLTTHAEKFRA